MVVRDKDVRLPSLASAAGTDILSLNFEAGASTHSIMQFSNTGNRSGPRYRVSNIDLRGSYRSSGYGLENQVYNNPFATTSQNSIDYPPPLPPLDAAPASYRRLRKHSSSSSLRSELGGDSLYSDPVAVSTFHGFRNHSGLPSSSRSMLPPLPPLGSMSSFPPLGGLSHLPP